MLALWVYRWPWSRLRNLALSPAIVQRLALVIAGAR
jgi:hypothetical protein